MLLVLVIIGGGLAGLAALPKHGGSKSAAQGGGDDGDDGEVIGDDGFFYGLSPAVYPSREFGFSVYPPFVVWVWRKRGTGHIWGGMC